ncbi:hypothetical protein [Shouchella patagoniensis]|uniref:hypothetical protein n=1 Tax=Shouchella patagoniensis TaxID=228576 RepID=UPI000994EB1C|nr:hypothetical protein [Shouchella patagoniensis]
MNVEFIDIDSQEVLHQLNGAEAETFLSYVATVNKVHLRISKDLSFLGAIAEIVYDLDYIRGNPSRRIVIRLTNIQIKRLN